MPRPAKKVPPIYTNISFPIALVKAVEDMAAHQHRSFSEQLTHSVSLGLLVESERNNPKLTTLPPPPPPPPKPAPRPVPAPMSYQAIRALAHNAIDQLKLRVTADDLPYLLAELSRYAVACRSLLLLGPAVDEEDDD